MTRMMASQMILRKWRTNKFVLKLDLKLASLGRQYVSRYIELETILKTII